MKKILAAIGEKIKRIIETAIGACLNQLIKLKEWLKRVRNGILNKLLVKISSLSLEGYSQQLIEERIKELRDSLPSEEGKEAKTLFDFISKFSNEDLGNPKAVEDLMKLSYSKDELEKAMLILGIIGLLPKNEEIITPSSEEKKVGNLISEFATRGEIYDLRGRIKEIEELKEKIMLLEREGVPLEEINELRKEINSLGERIPATISEQIEGLREEIKDLEKERGAPPEEINKLNTRIDLLENEIKGAVAKKEKIVIDGKIIEKEIDFEVV